jgi:N-acetylmuramic acid 6-phosphate etherase
MVEEQTWQSEARAFLEVAAQFALGDLPTEQAHPLTTGLSVLAARDPQAAAGLLLSVETQALELMGGNGAFTSMWQRLVQAIHSCVARGGRVVVTGCGATGRLALSLEKFARCGYFSAVPPTAVMGLMAGGDAALVRSIEGFEDRWEDGERQMVAAGIRPDDLVIGVTEGGETTWVLATVDWATRHTAHQPWLLFCNPPELLIQRLDRCRRVLGNPKVVSWYLATGPMAIAGSTRLQATSVQMAAMGGALLAQDPRFDYAAWVSRLIQKISSLPTAAIAAWAATEAAAFAEGSLLHYRAYGTGLTLLTDTTERSPTFSVRPFPNQWAHPPELPPTVLLTFPDQPTSADCWYHILGRAPRCLEWTHCQSLTGIKRLHGFDLSATGLRTRAKAGSQPWLQFWEDANGWLICDDRDCQLRLDDPSPLLAHLSLKAFMNCLSTLEFTLAGRVESNLMTFVRPANLKLIDRAIRTVRTLYQWRTGRELGYAEVCFELFSQRTAMAAEDSVVLRTLDQLLIKERQ